MRQKMWNVILVLDNVPHDEMITESLLGQFYTQGKADRFAEKQCVRPVDGTVIVTRRGIQK